MKPSPSISPLEQDVLDSLWPDKSLVAREVYQSIKPKRKVAPSSIAVMLDRLFQKGLVSRVAETGRGGTRYRYSPKTNKEQFQSRIIESTINALIDRFGTSAITYFEERFSKGGKR